MVGWNRPRLIATLLAICFLLITSTSYAAVSLKVDWKGADITVAELFCSGWSAVSLQDILTDSGLFSMTLTNSDDAVQPAYFRFGFDIDFDDPDYMDIHGASIEFEPVTIPARGSIRYGVNGVNVDISAVMDELRKIVQNPDGSSSDGSAFSGIDRDDVLTGDWPDVASSNLPAIDDPRARATGLGIASDLILNQQFPAGRYEMTIEVYAANTERELLAKKTLVTVISSPEEIAIESPRDGDEVDSIRPTFTWRAPDRADVNLEFTVTLANADGRRIFSERVGMDSVKAGVGSLTYPSTSDPLVPGRSYRWTLEVLDRTKTDDLKANTYFGNTLSATFKVYNEKPVATITGYEIEGYSRTRILTNDTVIFSGDAEDEEDDVLYGGVADSRLSWSVAGSERGSGRELRTSFDRPGSYEVRLTATDSGGATGSDTLTVQVYENSSPTITSITPSAATIALGESADFSVTATDPDQAIDDLVYVWSVNGNNLGFEQDFSFVPQRAGRYTVMVAVTDDQQATTVSRPIFLTVTDSAPAIDSITPSADSTVGVGGNEARGDADSFTAASGPTPGVLGENEVDTLGGADEGAGALLLMTLDVIGDVNDAEAIEDALASVPGFAGRVVVIGSTGGQGSDGQDLGGQGAGEQGIAGQGFGGQGTDDQSATTEAPVIVYIASPRDGEMRYSSELIQFTASHELEWTLVRADGTEEVLGTGNQARRLAAGDYTVSAVYNGVQIASMLLPVRDEELPLPVAFIQSITGDSAKVWVGTPRQGVSPDQGDAYYSERTGRVGDQLIPGQRVRVENGGTAVVQYMIDGSTVTISGEDNNPYGVDE